MTVHARYFAGKKYFFDNLYYTKRDAQEEVAKIRSRGNMARVVKNTRGYLVFYRR